MKKIIEFIKKTPKAELHLHIEGTLEPELLFELAKRNNIQIPYTNIEEVKSAYNFSDLQSFLNVFYQGSKVLVKEQDFFDLTWAYTLKCKEDNVVHTEVFFDPQTHINRKVNFDVIINGIFNALQKANKEFGLTSKIIMCFLRHLDEASAFQVLDQALIHKDKIIGVGLDSSEKDHPPRKFERVFKKAIENNFLTVAHAGEEGPPEYIWEALNLLKVKRIEQGVQCFQDKRLVKKLRDEQIPLTVCPLSNIKLRVFDKLKEHNIKKMLNEEIMVMVNSDDPAYFGGYLNKNLIETQSALDLSRNEVKILIINSFKSSFLEEDKKIKWIKQL